MANNFVQTGSVIDHTAASVISSGDVVVMGSLIGIALADIAIGEVGAVMIRGVFDLPKKNAAVIANGEQVLWDSSTGDFDDAAATPASGDHKGSVVALEAKGATTGETIRVLLTGAAGTLS